MLWYNDHLMNLIQLLNGIIIIVGVPSIVGALIYIGIKLHTLTVVELAVEKIKHNMKVMGDYLTRHHAKFNPTELRAFSPLQLTEVGTGLIKSVGFENVFEANKPDFFSFIDSEEPKLKYDVEVAATKSIYILADKPYMGFLKVFFYNNPDRNMENTAPTFGVYIRDKYLEAHTEITQ
jgi:hypothetical protein